MDLVVLLKAVILGIVEGLTEFLPISSTGHLILAESLLDFTGSKAEAFAIIIQAGAILAVVWEYRVRIFAVVAGLGHDPKARKFVVNLFIAFLPAAIVGLIFIKKIQAVLFKPVPVALAFIVGAFVILWVEHRIRTGQARPPRIDSIDDMTWLDALKVGFAQMFGIIPGTSRSGATIIGGMLFGLSRKAATEFSFFLAIPTLFAATGYSLWKERNSLVADDVPLLGVGLVVSFISAFFCVRWLLRYISTHTFVVFAWYRIAFGIVVLITAYTGMVAWTK
jgi:undecaprenyl-diphosphatase